MYRPLHDAPGGAMIHKYRGYTITVVRKHGPRHGRTRFWKITRDADGFVVDEGVGHAQGDVVTYIGFLKQDIDTELTRADPWCEQAERTHPSRELPDP